MKKSAASKSLSLWLLAVVAHAKANRGIEPARPQTPPAETYEEPPQQKSEEKLTPREEPAMETPRQLSKEPSAKFLPVDKEESIHEAIPDPRMDHAEPEEPQ